MEHYGIYKDTLKACRLFEGIPEKHISGMLTDLSPKLAKYRKGAIIFDPSGISDEFGIVLEGKVFGERVDFTGDRSVAGAIGKGGVFGEILVGGRRKITSITVYAAEDSVTLLFSYERLFCDGVISRPGYGSLIKNLLALIGDQYFTQSSRLYYLSRKTLRSKICAYLTDAADAAGSDSFEIPFNRDELASYLCAERSALSRELSRMRADDLIGYKGKSFRLKKAFPKY